MCGQAELRLNIPEDLPDEEQLKVAYLSIPGGIRKASFEEYLADPLLKQCLRRIVYNARRRQGRAA